jgi:hypothetical protein
MPPPSAWPERPSAVDEDRKPYCAAVPNAAAGPPPQIQSVAAQTAGKPGADRSWAPQERTRYYSQSLSSRAASLASPPAYSASPLAPSLRRLPSYWYEREPEEVIGWGVMRGRMQNDYMYSGKVGLWVDLLISEGSNCKTSSTYGRTYVRSHRRIICRDLWVNKLQRLCTFYYLYAQGRA